MDGVPQNPKRTDGTPGTGGEGLHVEGPGESRSKEDSQVVEGLRGGDVDGVPNPVPERQSVWLDSQVVGGRLGQVEEHRFRFFPIDCESQPAQPPKDVIRAPGCM
jgi:hypothetical protein